VAEWKDEEGSHRYKASVDDQVVDGYDYDNDTDNNSEPDLHNDPDSNSRS
jgi:hypothetical protein